MLLTSFNTAEKILYFPPHYLKIIFHEYPESLFPDFVGLVLGVTELRGHADVDVVIRGVGGGGGHDVGVAAVDGGGRRVLHVPIAHEVTAHQKPKSKG